MSIADLVKKFGGDFEFSGNTHMTMMGGESIDIEIDSMPDIEIDSIIGGLKEDNVAVINISVTSSDKNNEENNEENNKNTKPFKSYLYNILDKLVI